MVLKNKISDNSRNNPSIDDVVRVSNGVKSSVSLGKYLVGTNGESHVSVEASDSFPPGFLKSPREHNDNNTYHSNQHVPNS